MTRSRDYKIDFRTLDALVWAIEGSTKAEITTAREVTEEFAQADYIPATSRPIWNALARLLREQEQRF